MSIKKRPVLALTGEDRRTLLMEPMLRDAGFVVLKGLTLREACRRAQVLIGGTPLGRDGEWGRLLRETESAQACENMEKREELAEWLHSDYHIFGGAISDAVQEQCGSLGVICHDFMKEETVAVYNTVATAEGVIAEAICSKATNLHKSPVLVLGYGRCGKTLAYKLKQLDCRVCVASREKEELAQAESMGLCTMALSELSEQAGKFAYLFNTIPARVLTREVLLRVQRDVLILDIASGEGGTDWDAAKSLSLSAKRCPALPGRYAAQSSAQILAEYVIKELQKEYGTV